MSLDRNHYVASRRLPVVNPTRTTPASAIQSPRRRVALVSAPFGGVDTPSLALGLLAETLRREGHEVDVHHLDLDVVKAFGLDVYRLVAEDSGWKLLVGEWLAADSSLTPGTSDPATFAALLREHAAPAWRQRFASVDLSALRRSLNSQVERWTETIEWSRYDVVGFTVMFQQLNTSLRLAQAIKSQHPEVRVVLGGINLENPMGTAVARRFPWLDAVFSGYADKTLPRYVAELPDATGGVVTPGDERIALDELPVPTYDEYLTKLRALGLSNKVALQLPFETSRGCWWGEKHHCVFCGLNGAQMTYVAKSPERVLSEVRTLQRHGLKLLIIDNILSPNIYKDLLPLMRREGARLELHWSASLKANLKRAQLEGLAAAGIDIINPGIESLSTDILRLMDKGETSIQNLWLLRACRELGVQPEWNFLYGIPGEDSAAYAEQAELMRSISHLPPPYGMPPVTMIRFSPMHDRPESFGLTNVRPHRAYRHAFGDHPTLEDFAFIFEYDHARPENPEVYARPALDAVVAWQRLRPLWRRPRCEVVEWRGRRWVLDTRSRRGVGIGRPLVHRLGARAWQILERLESATLDATLERESSDASAALHADLSALEQRRLVIHRDGRWMRLVVFPEHGALSRAVRHVAARIRRF